MNRVFLEQHTYTVILRKMCEGSFVFVYLYFWGWFNVMNRFIKTFPSWNLRWMVTIENLKNKSFRYKLWFTKANNNETYLSKLSSYDQIKGLLIVILVLNFHDFLKKRFTKNYIFRWKEEKLLSERKNRKK